MAVPDPGRTTGFPCRQCGAACPSLPGLLEHMDAHLQEEEERKFKCDECGRGYRHAGSLANHKKTHQVGSFQCNTCGKEYCNALALKSHLRSHTSQKKHSCDECGKAFRLASQLGTHARVHLSRRVKEKPFGEADVEHPTRETESETETEYEYENDLGEPAAGDEPEVVYNARAEAPDGAAERPFGCDLCDKSYIHHRSLTNHKKTHQVGVFECPVCFKQFSNMAALYSHQRTHRTRSGAEPGAIGGSASSATPPGRFSPQSHDSAVNFCHLCQVLFPNDAEFQEHIQMHNSSSSAPFGLHDAAAESLDVSYDSSVASPESTFYASPLNDAPSISSGDHLGGSDQPTERIRSNGHVSSDRPRNQTPPVSSARGEPAAGDTSPRRAAPLPADNGDDAPEAEEAEAEAGDSAGRRFRCRICSKSYRHSGSLINHKRSHQVGIYQCSICRKSYPHLAALKSHLRLHKNQPSSFGEGDWLSSEPLTLDTQQGCFSSQEEGEEEEEEELGLNQEKAVEHRASSHDPFHQDVLHRPHDQLQRHMCADCGETFSDIAGIKCHSCPTLRQRRDAASADYDGEGRFPQSVGRRAPGAPPSPAELHGLSGGREQSYFEQNFHDALSLDQTNGDEDGGHHDEDEDDDGDLCQCSICGNRYTSMRALRSHLRGHAHGTPGSSGPSSMSSHEETKEDEPAEMMICSACGESFASRQDWLLHQLLHKEEQEVDPVFLASSGASAGGEQSAICGRCGVFCSSFHHLDDHGCSDPPGAEEERKGAGAARHEETPASGGRRYQCDQCGRSYRHAGSLLNHKKSHKTGVFRCLVCQKRFYNLLALKNHQRSHFDIKRHGCPECGKAFKIQKQLLNHLRRHKENRAKIQELNNQIQALMNEAQAPPPAGAQAPPPSRRCKRAPVGCGAAVKAEAAGDQRPFACDQCGRTYRHAGSLVNHRNAHKTGDFSCSVCSNTFSNQLAMRSHLRTHAASEKHRCQRCGEGFRGKKQLSGHRCADARKEAAQRGRRVLAARAARCRACRRAFVSAAQLAAHACGGQAKASGREERPFACDLCSRSYRHAGSLLNHKNTHKTGSFSCSFCAKPFSNPMALRNHTRIHTQKKKYACLTCGKAFRLASILLNHQRVHDRAARPFSCPACGKSFQGRAGLKRHRCRRGGQENAPRAGVQQSERGDRCFMCDLCGRSYRHAGSLLNHKKTHSESLLHCSLCLQTFPDALTLQIHAMMRRHCCPECGKTFCLVAHLQSHMEVHSKDQRSAPHTASCRRRGDGGDGGARRDSGMDLAPPPSAHIPGSVEPQRREDKSHVCERCGRAYRHAGSLLNHKNSHKTGAFPCAACHKQFTNLMALRNHRRIHTEPKRYQCLQCGKAFRVATQLVCHRRVHSQEKPFGCPLCAKSFSSKASLRHHQEAHTQPCASFMEADAFMDLDMGSFL